MALDKDLANNLKIALDKKDCKNFSYSSIKTYVVGTH